MKYVNENGRSMVEMLGVLAIIGVLSVGGIAGYSKAMNKFKINKTTDQVTMLVANIRTMFATQGNYDGLTEATAVQYGLIPNDMYTQTAQGGYDSIKGLKNAFAGEVTITAVPARSANANNTTETGVGAEAFVIAYDNLSEEACVAMLTGDWGSGQASGLISVAGGKGNAAAAKGWADGVYTDNQTDAATTSVAEGVAIAAPGGKYNVPLKVSDAVLACNGGNSGNAVAWKYY